MKTKAEMLLRVLEGGHEVEDKNGARYCLIDNKICTFWQAWIEDDDGNVGQEKEEWMDTSISFTGFMKMAERFDRDYLWLKGCELALRDMKRKDRNVKRN